MLISTPWGTLCYEEEEGAYYYKNICREQRHSTKQLTLDGKELQRERKEVVCVVLLPLPTAAAASQLLSSARRRLGK